MDAPPGLGVLEALEALPFESMSVAAAGAVVRAVAVVHGRADVVQGKALAVFSRGNGAQVEGATDTTAWLANATKTSGREAKRAVKRSRVLDALPALAEALAAGEISAAHVDEIAAIVPAPLLPKAGGLVAAAMVVRGGRCDSRRVSGCSSSIGTRGCGPCSGSGIRQTAAAIERAVDLVADELWRAEHPTRNPTRLEETSLKFRRAQAVTEIARRVLNRTDTEAADAAPADADAPADTAPADTRRLTRAG